MGESCAFQVDGDIKVGVDGSDRLGLIELRLQKLLFRLAFFLASRAKFQFFSDLLFSKLIVLFP